MAAGSLHCSGYIQVGCDGGWTAEQRVLISFKKPISILSSLSPVHAVAPNGKFVGVEITKRREREPVQLPPCQGHEPRVKKETAAPAKTLFVPIFMESLLRLYRHEGNPMPIQAVVC